MHWFLVFLQIIEKTMIFYFARFFRSFLFFQVGTYYGEKVYKLVPNDTLIEPIFHEYYAHTDPKEWYKRSYIKLMS